MTARITQKFDLDRSCSRFLITMTWQSSHLRLGLPPALMLCAITMSAGAVSAQEPFRVQLVENFRRDSTTAAPVLASLRANQTVRAEDVGGRWMRVTLEGWIWAASLEPTSRDGFHVRVSPVGGENLRDAPNGAVVAELEEGCLLTELQRQGDWVHIRRIGWVWGQSLAAVDGQQAVAAGPPANPSIQEEPSDLDRALVADPTALRRVPDGDTTATLRAETAVRVLARSGDWVRVQTEGWIREDELRAGAPGVLVGISGAEVRSRPDAFANRAVQWTVQLISVARADEVRYDIPAGQRYLLTRGPLPETGFVYITITDQQVEEFELMEPLTELVIVGRVRTGRSRYLGNPVLQLEDYALRRQ